MTLLLKHIDLSIITIGTVLLLSSESCQGKLVCSCKCISNSSFTGQGTLFVDDEHWYAQAFPFENGFAMIDPVTIAYMQNSAPYHPKKFGGIIDELKLFPRALLVEVSCLST